jgi:hypothetical protein
MAAPGILDRRHWVEVSQSQFLYESGTGSGLRRSNRQFGHQPQITDTPKNQQMKEANDAFF